MIPIPFEKTSRETSIVMRFAPSTDAKKHYRIRIITRKETC